MVLCLVFLAGMLFGIVVTVLKYYVGTLRVDKSDPDEPYIFLELDKRLGNVVSKKYVLLKVKLENFIPHK